MMVNFHEFDDDNAEKHLIEQMCEIRGLQAYIDFLVEAVVKTKEQEGFKNRFVFASNPVSRTKSLGYSVYYNADSEYQKQISCIMPALVRHRQLTPHISLHIDIDLQRKQLSFRKNFNFGHNFFKPRYTDFCIVVKLRHEYSLFVGDVKKFRLERSSSLTDFQSLKLTRSSSVKDLSESPFVDSDSLFATL